VTITLRDAGNRALVVLLPITHSPPAADQVGVELPQRVKLHLGLDRDRSWVIVSECNIDGWPSPDRDAFVDNYGNRRVSVVTRNP
jgi:hypothetical protein